MNNYIVSDNYIICNRSPTMQDICDIPLWINVNSNNWIVYINNGKGIWMKKENETTKKCQVCNCEIKVSGTNQEKVTCSGCY